MSIVPRFGATNRIYDILVADSTLIGIIPAAQISGVRWTGVPPDRFLLIRPAGGGIDDRFDEMEDLEVYIEAWVTRNPNQATDVEVLKIIGQIFSRVKELIHRKYARPHPLTSADYVCHACYEVLAPQPFPEDDERKVFHAIARYRVVGREV